ncbi:MAG: MerR family transcriptional regulator [Bifidobacteriaceae bacterium]|jgi:DNA-binding transcriptional MerR regulator|nr:MerR family transcriptional regulator [Bifidobacteriaceae bacterium]
MSTAQPNTRLAEPRPLKRTPLEFASSEAAELTGLTVRAVRYYGEVGLLSKPRRESGGQLVYTREHILQLLRIKRLTALGLSLDEVASVVAGPHTPRSTRLLKDLERALADRIAELQAQRRVIRELMSTGSPIDTLAEFARSVAALRRVGALTRIDDARGELLPALAAAVGGIEEGELDGFVEGWAAELGLLEEALLGVDKNSSEDDVTGLALDYGRVLTQIYQDYAMEGASHPARWLVNSGIEEIASALSGSAMNPRQREVLSRAAIILAASVNIQGTVAPDQDPVAVGAVG